MIISAHYVLVKRSKLPESTGDFIAVEAADDFVYKGEIVALPDVPVFISNERLGIGMNVLFAKYSPDTFEYDGKEFDPNLEGKVKLVKQTDLLAIVN